MNVVSNASPLVNLGRIGQLGLLPQVYGELPVPEAVWHEVVVQGRGQPGAHEVETADWVRVAPVANRALVLALRQELDAGEAEAIGLATYKETLDVVEYYLSYGGLGCSAAADYYGGYTYLDTDNTRYGLPELVIGEDTVRDFVAQGIGRLVPVAIVDFGLNTIQGFYSWNSLVQDPTWELRMVVGRIPFDQPPTDWYIKNYGKD